MKSFSAPRPATGSASHAAQPVSWGDADDPRASLTDMQWFMLESHDVVFNASFLSEVPTRAAMHERIAQMVDLAPQLGAGFRGGQVGRPLTQEQLEAISSVVEVDDFDGYPDKVLSLSEDVFLRDDLPLFRVELHVRRDGADARGRAAMVLVRGSHAIFEGADSALLTRSQSTGHTGPAPTRARPKPARVGGFIHLMLANLLGRGAPPVVLRSLAIERSRLRRLADALGIRQRSLYFALTTFAINGPGRRIGKKLKVLYTSLDGGPGKATAIMEEQGFRLKVVQTKFRAMDDFTEYARAVDRITAEVEAGKRPDPTAGMDSVMAFHRMMHKRWPKLYGTKFFSFTLPMDLALTMVPPHRAAGPLTKGLMEPIYVGAWHPDVNTVAFCPGRRQLAITFAITPKLAEGIDAIMPLLETLEAKLLEPEKTRLSATVTG